MLQPLPPVLTDAVSLFPPPSLSTIPIHLLAFILCLNVTLRGKNHCFCSLRAQPPVCLYPDLGLLDATVMQGRENSCDGSMLDNLHRLLPSTMWGKWMLLLYSNGEKWRHMSLIRNVLKILLLILNIWAEIQSIFFLKSLWCSLVFNIGSPSAFTCRRTFSAAQIRSLGDRRFESGLDVCSVFSQASVGGLCQNSCHQFNHNSSSGLLP